jgi:hypothetical protein
MRTQDCKKMWPILGPHLWPCLSHTLFPLRLHNGCSSHSTRWLFMWQRRVCTFIFLYNQGVVSPHNPWVFMFVHKNPQLYLNCCSKCVVPHMFQICGITQVCRGPYSQTPVGETRKVAPGLPVLRWTMGLRETSSVTFLWHLACFMCCRSSVKILYSKRCSEVLGTQQLFTHICAVVRLGQDQTESTPWQFIKSGSSVKLLKTSSAILNYPEMSK